MANEITAERFVIFRQYYDELVRFLTVKLRSRDQALDIAQEAFLHVLTKSPSASISRPRAFLYKTALNLTVDLFRRQRIRSEGTIQLEVVEKVPSGIPRQDCELEAKERVRLLYAAINNLPPKCRQVFLLHKFKGLSHADIARQLGISKNMVEKHVMKAMDHCRRQVEEV